jgi:Pyruvate/2-oxoacid:ferredoxin oxidoreductase gamma subunit/ferredoxin
MITQRVAAMASTPVPRRDPRAVHRPGEALSVLGPVYRGFAPDPTLLTSPPPASCSPSCRPACEIARRPIRSTYRIRRAQLIAIHDPEALERRDVLAAAMPGATVLVNTPIAADRVWDALPREVQDALIAKRCRLFVIDGYGVAERAGLGRRINTVMQACFFALSNVLPLDEALGHIRRNLAETFGKRGPEVVRRNVAAQGATLEALREVPVPASPSTERHRLPAVPPGAPDFVQRVTRLLLEGKGDELPVSAFPPEVFAPKAAAGAPAGFRSVPEKQEAALSGLRYTVQVAPEDCTGCGLCVEVCPTRDRKQPRRKALVSEPLAAHRAAERDALGLDRRVRADHRAEVALRAEVGLPDRDALRERALLEPAGTGRPGAVHICSSVTRRKTTRGSPSRPRRRTGRTFAAAGKATRKKDLGLLAMSYGHVYVASIALHARSAQTVQAFLEAERHPGPSLLIAHSPCIAHGYDLVHAPTQQKRAVDSGMWPLYRFDPHRAGSGEPPLVLDSRAPHLDVATYMENEPRFRMVELRSPERYQQLIAAAREAVRQRWSLYEQLAKIQVPS